jgi:hypothetical protein
VVGYALKNVLAALTGVVKGESEKQGTSSCKIHEKIGEKPHLCKWFDHDAAA